MGGAIIEYLVDRYGNGWLVPASGTPEHLRYRYWLHYAEGSAMPPKEFLDRIHARPTYKRALERGGRYDFANSSNL